MAQNKLPQPIGELLDLARRNLQGIITKGASINLLQYTAANFGPLITALETKQGLFNIKRAELGTAFDNLHAAEAVLRAKCLTARKILSISWGDEWNSQWTQGGWNNNTTAVPKDGPGLRAIISTVRALLLADGDYEIETPKVVFTSDSLAAPITEYDNRNALTDTAKGAKDTAGDNRGVEEEALRKAMRGLNKLLGEMLDPMSPIWDDFGLNRPGATVTPAKPEGLTLTRVSQGRVLGEVPPVPLATYYRWKYMVVGVDAEFRFWGRTNDPLVEMEGLPATGTLRAFCEAANEAGPGPKSATVEINLAG